MMSVTDLAPVATSDNTKYSSVPSEVKVEVSAVTSPPVTEIAFPSNPTPAAAPVLAPPKSEQDVLLV